MKHLKLIACIAVACSAFAGPARAIEPDPQASFEDLLTELSEHRLVFPLPQWRDRSDAPWIPQTPQPGFDHGALFGRSRFEWTHHELDDWPESLRRWGFDNAGHWQGHGGVDPYCIPAIPEPSGLALMAGGLLALGVVRRRRR